MSRWEAVGRHLRERRPGRAAGSALAQVRDLFADAASDIGLVLASLAHMLVARLTAGRRDDDLWVFGARGGEGFVDNAKYLYLHIAHERPDVEPIWLSKDRETVRRLRVEGHRAHYSYSLGGIATCLRAGVVVVTQGLGDANLTCSGGAKVVNLWHGIPLKTISWDAEFPDQSLPFRLTHEYLSRQVDLLTIPGNEIIPQLHSGLRVSPDRMVTTGYPRTDALFEKVPGEQIGLATDAFRSVEALAADHPVVFYLPTFRRGEGEPVAEHFDPERLNPVLADHDAYLFVKTHPFESFDVPDEFEHIRQLPADTDIYPFLRLADVLVTDYSSVFFDYLVTDDPIVFYPYDLDRYRASRGFYFDYEAVTPGPVATDQDQLLTALDATLEGEDDYAFERRAVRERFIAHPEPGRSAAVYRAIREQADLDSPSQASRWVRVPQPQPEGF